MGRKRLEEGKALSSSLLIRLTEADRRILDRAAEDAGLGTSTWARDVLLKAAGKPAPKTPGKKS